MFTNLDLLLIVFMVLTALSLISLSLMFLLKNKNVQKGVFYLMAVLVVYLAYVGIRAGYLLSSIHVILAIAAVVFLAVAIFVERVSKGNEKKFLTARIISAASLVVGFFNILLIL